MKDKKIIKNDKKRVFLMISPYKKTFVRGKPAADFTKKKRVFVMMSGGVDSSVAAYLLSQNKKYEVTGMFIKGYNIDGCQEKDATDARRVAGFLNIPFYVIDLEKEYKNRVVDYMIDGYKNGITPNPDVMCNKEIKFGVFLKKAVELGADFVATGHYTRLRREIRNSKSEIRKKIKKQNLKKESFQLYQANDKNKDQSYFLWTLTQNQLKHCLFPIGNYLKPEIRVIAKKAGLPTALKKDSQGICFLGQISIRDFLKQFLPVKKGDIRTMEGKVIGKHDGTWFYTIGQRHGLGIVGAEKPYYVSGKDEIKNILFVSDKDNRELYKSSVKLTSVNLTGFIGSLIHANKKINVLVRIRYRQPLVKAKLIYVSKNKYRLVFGNPQKSVANGQSAVFYNKKGDMLGGGIIL